MNSRMKKRKLKKGAALVIGAIALIISLFIGKGILSLFGPSQPFTIEASQALKLDEFEKLKLNVEFSNNKSINKLVKLEVENIINENKELFLSKEKSINVEAEYSKQYNFVTYKVLDGEENLHDLHGTFLIDLKTGESIASDDIYLEDLKGLSMLVREYLAKDPSLKYNKNTYSKTLPDKSNFKNVGFSDQEFIVYYNMDTLASEKYGEARIPIYEAINYFNDDLMKRIDKDYERKEMNVRYIDPSKPMLAITFDDGPLASTSLKVAEYFAEKNQRLTFFWLGSRIETSKEIVKEVYDLGHEIANHSYDHSDFNTLSSDELKKQTSDVNDLIKSITKQENVLIRPPFGSGNQKVRDAVDSPLILWSVDTLDWSTRDEDQVYKDMQVNLNDGNIILLHDLYATSTDAAIRFLDDYIDKYQFVTVSELHQYSGQALKEGEFTTGVRR